MNWKFWQKNGESINGGERPHQPEKLPKPKELHQQVGIFLITRLKEDPDWIWGLKMVSCPMPEKKHVARIRIYNPHDAAATGVAVINYHSLDDHAELIIFEGLFNKSAGAVDVARPMKEAA